MIKNKVLLPLIGFLTFFVVSTANAGTFSMGVSAQLNDLDTAASEDIDNNGSTDETKSVSDTVATPSIFAEYSMDLMGANLTLGIDLIPLSAEIDKREITQTVCGAKAAGACGEGGNNGGSGNNSASGTIKNHITIYVQPSFEIAANTSAFLTAGFAMADVEGRSKSLSSTDISEDRDLEGWKFGLGLKHNLSDSTFVKVDYSYTDYDAVSWTTTNSTKGTADIENSNIGLSIGTNF